MREIGQGRHVHDRHARHTRTAHLVEQRAHLWLAILRLLHGEHGEVRIRGDPRPPGPPAVSSPATRASSPRPLAPLHRHAPPPAPFALMRAASAGRQTSFTECPARAAHAGARPPQDQSVPELACDDLPSAIRGDTSTVGMRRPLAPAMAQHRRNNGSNRPRTLRPLAARRRVDLRRRDAHRDVHRRRLSIPMFAGRTHSVARRAGALRSAQARSGSAREVVAAFDVDRIGARRGQRATPLPPKKHAPIAAISSVGRLSMRPTSLSANAFPAPGMLRTMRSISFASGRLEPGLRREPEQDRDHEDQRPEQVGEGAASPGTGSSAPRIPCR